MDLQQCVEFRHFQEPRLPLPDGYGELAVSIFDLHRHPAEQYLTEAETLKQYAKERKLAPEIANSAQKLLYKFFENQIYGRMENATSHRMQKVYYKAGEYLKNVYNNKYNAGEKEGKLFPMSEIETTASSKYDLEKRMNSGARSIEYRQAA